jgi:hypothetical protein
LSPGRHICAKLRTDSAAAGAVRIDGYRARRLLRGSVIRDADRGGVTFGAGRSSSGLATEAADRFGSVAPLTKAQLVNDVLNILRQTAEFGHPPLDHAGTISTRFSIPAKSDGFRV